jgi:hypothetical protein
VKIAYRVFVTGHVLILVAGQVNVRLGSMTGREGVEAMEATMPIRIAVVKEIP